MNLWYGDFQALFDVNLDIRAGVVTSMIGPSGCGKSTLLRSVNRINERLGYVRTTGTIKVYGEDIYAETSSAIQVRRHIGMVFQRPNPLPLSVAPYGGGSAQRAVGTAQAAQAGAGGHSPAPEGLLRAPAPPREAGGAPAGRREREGGRRGGPRRLAWSRRPSR